MKDIGSFIDHTLLKADADSNMIRNLCNEAMEYGFYSVCVNPSHVSLCKEILKESHVKIATVIGFPLGANTSKIKGYEAKDAMDNGADELDMVINIGALKDKDYDLVRQDIKTVVDLAKPDLIVKVIIETSLLDEQEKITACKLAMEAGADFVKTSTGFSGGGASISDIELMRSVVGDLGIKASGGIRDYDTAIKMIDAGATRIGASSSVKIVNERG